MEWAVLSWELLCLKHGQLFAGNFQLRCQLMHATFGIATTELDLLCFYVQLWNTELHGRFFQCDRNWTCHDGIEEANWVLSSVLLAVNCVWALTFSHTCSIATSCSINSESIGFTILGCLREAVVILVCWSVKLSTLFMAVSSVAAKVFGFALW